MTERTLILGTEANRSLAVKIVSALNLARPWELVLREHHPKRTNSQNSRLWKLHTLAANVVGCSPEDMHNEMLCRHFGCNEVKVGGAIVRFPLKRSSARNIKEFGQFMEYCEAFYIAELGVWLS